MRRDYSYPLRVAADRFPDRVAFVHREERWTYRDFDAATDRLAAAFQQRGLAGCRVVLLLRNEPLTVMTYLALARAGAAAVPVNPKLLLNEIAFVAEDCGACAAIVDAEFVQHGLGLQQRCGTVEQVITVNARPVDRDHERVEDLAGTPGAAPAAGVDADSPALVVYTSGTSGVPKGVVRTHEANLWTIVNAQIGQPRSSQDTEVFVLPLFGIAFVFQVMPMLMAGGTVVLDGGFDPDRTWELLEQHRATRVFLAPTMIDSMLAVEGHEARDVSALRVLNTAYEFPARVREAAQDRFGDVVAYMYGLTEAQLCCSTAEQFARDPTDAGHPMGMMRVRVVDDRRRPVDRGVVGEITLEGPSLMSGYHGREEATAEALVDGWLYTGDLGYLDEHGRVHVSGRKKEMIKTGGFSVDPVEVENAILGFPGVREAVVVGAPDEHWGEQVVAFVSATPDVQAVERELREHVRGLIAAYKCPKRLVFLADLPKTPTGKVQRGALRALAAERTEGGGAS